MAVRGPKYRRSNTFVTPLYMPVKPTICQRRCVYLHVIKLLENTEPKCTNNASHEVKEFCLLKLPVGAHDAHRPWAYRVVPVHGQCRSLILISFDKIGG
jgi:hypothetical protein